jgi:hypothetical protein
MKALKVGDIVRMDFTKHGEKIVPYRYVVVAIPPTNDLVRGRVDVIRIEDAKMPLTARGVGMPTKYLKKIGRLVV